MTSTCTERDFLRPNAWCLLVASDVMRVKWAHEARLIVLFLSSSNSGSLGIEFKWVTWLCLAPDAAYLWLCQAHTELGPALSGLSLLSALQSQLDTNSGPNGSIFHSSALVTSPNLTRPRPPPLLTSRRVWVMTNKAFCILLLHYYSLTPPLTRLITSLLLVFNDPQWGFLRFKDKYETTLALFVVLLREAGLYLAITGWLMSNMKALR